MGRPIRGPARQRRVGVSTSSGTGGNQQRWVPRNPRNNAPDSTGVGQSNGVRSFGTGRPRRVFRPKKGINFVAAALAQEAEKLKGEFDAIREIKADLQKPAPKPEPIFKEEEIGSIPASIKTMSLRWGSSRVITRWHVLLPCAAFSLLMLLNVIDLSHRHIEALTMPRWYIFEYLVSMVLIFACATITALYGSFRPTEHEVDFVRFIGDPNRDERHDRFKNQDVKHWPLMAEFSYAHVRASLWGSTRVESKLHVSYELVTQLYNIANANNCLDSKTVYQRLTQAARQTGTVAVSRHCASLGWDVHQDSIILAQALYEHNQHRLRDVDFIQNLRSQ